MKLNSVDLEMASDSFGMILANVKMETLINGDFSGKFDTSQTLDFD